MPVFHTIRVFVNNQCRFAYIPCHPGQSSRRERSRQLDFIRWDVRFAGAPHSAEIIFPSGTPLNTNVVQVPATGVSAFHPIVTNNFTVFKYSVQVGSCFDDPDIEVEPPVAFELADNLIAVAESGEITLRGREAVNAGDFVRWISHGPPEMLDFVIQFDEERSSPLVSGEHTIQSVPGVGANLPRQTLNEPGRYPYLAILTGNGEVTEGELVIKPRSQQP